MKCFNPFFKKFIGYEYAFALPCGHCPACRYNQANNWALRLQLEALEYNPNELAFLTLTYDNEHCPVDYSLDSQAVSGFVKRLRKHLPYNIRFFGCGEYGDRFQRPHYHLILFGIKDYSDILHFTGVDKMDWVFKGNRPLPHHAWKLGFVQVEQPRSAEAVASYVSQYVTKKLRVTEYHSRVAPYHRQSLGLGKAFLDRLPFYTPVIEMAGFTRYLGKYLKNKLAEKFGVLEQVKKQSMDALYEKMKDIISVFDPLRIKFHLHHSLEKSAYFEYYSGEFDLQRSQLKLKSVRLDL